MTLDQIVAEEKWELMSLCLLLGMLRSSLAMPEDSLTELLEVLEGDLDE